MSDFYNKAFKECEIYLKENTKAFLDRQIEVHLSKTPDKVDYPDKNELAKWIKISAGLLLKKDVVEKLAEKILSLEASVKHHL